MWCGDLFTQGGIPSKDYANIQGRGGSTKPQTSRLTLKPGAPHTKPFPLKKVTVKKEPASSSRGGKNAKKEPNINAKTFKGRCQMEPNCSNGSIVKREPHHPMDDVAFQMCIPGEGDPVCQVASLNVQQPEWRFEQAEESDTNFMMVPTQSALVDAVCQRGRKPNMARCNDGKCGQCRRCRCRAYWDKHGASHAAEVMSVCGQKKCAWAVWKDEGLGCVICFNYRLALAKAGLRPEGVVRRLSKECPWASFKMLIYRKSALRRHEETLQHRKAVAFHATGKLTCEGTNFPSDFWA